MSPVRYRGENVFLRWWPPFMLAFAFIVLTGAGKAPVFYAAVFAICGLIGARMLPWRFEVVDEGIVLWFPFARLRFLPRDAITVRVAPGSAVASLDDSRRMGYPLSDGIVERRHDVLRAVLAEHGFRLA